MAPRLLISGTHSGVGKTTLVVALARAFRARGLKVALFKCGPDYLDPTYHLRATGAPSHNLDGWMMGREAVRATFSRCAEGADLALIEGMMGLFDGASPTSEAGSSAEIAKWLQAPVALVADVSGMARSAAALAQGFRDFDPEVRVAALLANRAGGQGHLDLLKAASPLPVLGGLPRDAAPPFPERHLGLHRAEDVLTDAQLDAWAQAAETWCDLDALLNLAKSAPPLPLIPSLSAARAARRCRIAYALDEALHFYYEDNLRRLEAEGAELVPFSLLRDRLPEVDGLYLGGGYPELHAEALAARGDLFQSLRDFAAAGRPVYGECGGLMVLARSIRTLDGRHHPMAGLLPFDAVMTDRLQALGYAEVETLRPTPLGPAGQRMRGHQFRHSRLEQVPDDLPRAYALRGCQEGYLAGSVLASYVHVHWASAPEVPTHLVGACLKARGQDTGA